MCSAAAQVANPDYERGVKMIEGGRPADAVAPLEAAVKAEPKNAQFWKALGVAYAAQGDVATYIPSLEEVRPDSFGLAVVEMDGTEHVTGAADVPFPIQSISKVIALVHAMQKADAAEGIAKELWERVGREPSGNPVNSHVQLEHVVPTPLGHRYGRLQAEPLEILIGNQQVKSPLDARDELGKVERIERPVLLKVIGDRQIVGKFRLHRAQVFAQQRDDVRGHGWVTTARARHAAARVATIGARGSPIAQRARAIDLGSLGTDDPAPTRMTHKTYQDFVREAKARVAEVTAGDTRRLLTEHPGTVLVDVREPATLQLTGRVVDDGAVLSRMRSKSVDCGRVVVPLPLLVARDGSAPTPSRWRD